MEGDHSYCLVGHSRSRPVRVVAYRGLTGRDIIADRLRSKLSYDFSLPQVLESATWKCGRIIAAEKRENGGPPIEIESDGTIF
jgi:hypothetical protein